MKVGSTNVPAGDYKVTWTGSGDNAQVTLTKGKYESHRASASDRRKAFDTTRSLPELKTAPAC